MLGSLIKHDFKNTCQYMGVSFAALAVVTIMGSIGLHAIQTDIDNPFLNFLSVFMLILYFIGVVAVFICNYIYLCRYYFKTMYSAQGYLTHTLPCTELSILNAKLLTSFCWMLLGIILCGLSVVILIVAGGNFDLISELLSLDWGELEASLNEVFHMSLASFIGFIGIGTLLSILTYLLFIYACFALGQLTHKNRTAATVLSGVGLYSVYKLLGYIELLINGYGSVIRSSLIGRVEDMVIGSKLFVTDLIFELIAVCSLYAIVLLINQKKLNLE